MKTTQCYATIWSISVSHDSVLTQIRWGKNECTLHNTIVLAIFVPEIIKVGKNLTDKVLTKTTLTVFLRHCVHCLNHSAFYVQSPSKQLSSVYLFLRSDLTPVSFLPWTKKSKYKVQVATLKNIMCFFLLTNYMEQVRLILRTKKILFSLESFEYATAPSFSDQQHRTKWVFDLTTDFIQHCH